MDSSSNKEENYWPGFVDALSNVVLTLVFVLVVFVFALSMVSSKVEERMKEVLEREKAHSETLKYPDMPQTVEELQRQLVEAQEELDKLRSAMPDAARPNSAIEILVEETENADAAKVSDVSIRKKDTAIDITYPPFVTELNEKSAAQLEETLDGMRASVSGSRILLRSHTGNEPFSTAQRMAYYRAMVVRNSLMAKGLGDSSSIVSRIIVSKTPGNGHVEIVFEK